MASYIENNLQDGEKIIYRGHRHWIVFAWPLAWLIITLFFFFRFNLMENLTIFPALITLVIGFDAFIDYGLSELAVTNVRVMIKIGLIARSSLETPLENISSINVEQSMGGRLLGYGTLIFNDVGHVRSPFRNISHPFEFRKAVLAQIHARKTSWHQEQVSTEES